MPRFARLRFLTAAWCCLAGGLQSAAQAERVLLCGLGEVFEIEVARPQEKLWSWRAKERDDVMAEWRTAFATTDDCKPVEGGTRVLISSSSGGCALVERPSGRVLWQARVPNAHSLELLPGGRIVVASSVHAEGNRLLLFDASRTGGPLWETELKSAHGVVWDAGRERLWALGFTELRCYALKDWDGAGPSLALEAVYALPEEDGHDLQPVPKSDDLTVTTAGHVYLFDRETRTFRSHPVLGEKAEVKCVITHPVTGRTLYLHGDGTNWWTDRLHLLAPEEEIALPAERLYKGRWLAE